MTGTGIKLITYHAPPIALDHLDIESRVIKGRLQYRHVNDFSMPIHDKWWDFALPFCHGYAVVRRAREFKYRIINMRGTLVSKYTFLDVGNITKDGTVRVLHGKYIRTARWRTFSLWNRTFTDEN